MKQKKFIYYLYKFIVILRFFSKTCDWMLWLNTVYQCILQNKKNREQLLENKKGILDFVLEFDYIF